MWVYVEWKRELIIFLEALDFEMHFVVLVKIEITSIRRISVSMNADAVDSVVDFRVAKKK